jgi:hypothetical protein
MMRFHVLGIIANLTCSGGKMRLMLIILGCLFFSHTYAVAHNVYKCTDANGKKNYQYSPCAAGVANTTLNIGTGSSTNLDEENKQQELKQKADQASLEEQKLTKQQMLEKQENENKAAIAESAKNQELVKSDAKKFAPFAIPPYAPDKLPDFVKNYQSRLSDVERFRRVAAEKALSTDQCDRVEASELDVKSTKTLLAFLVNCSSGKAFYYHEQDLK